MRKLKLFFACLLMAVLSIGQVWGDSYTITFKSNSTSSDGTSQIQSSTTVSDYVSDGASYVSAISGSGKVFLGISGYGLKFGNSSNPGTVTLTLAEAVKPDSIVINASPWSATEGKGVLQDSVFNTTRTGAKGTFANFKYVYDGNTEVTTITLGTNSNGKRGYVKSVTVFYTSEAPSYTISAQSNDESKGTVSLTGSVITGSPKVNCRYASPAYTVTSGTATVTQSGNAFTVTPSSDCTVRINFEAIPQYTVTWDNNGDENTTTQVYEGEKPVFPATPAACDATSTTFIGWATAPWDGKLANLSGKTVYSSADAMPAVSAAVTYYAVFAKSSGSASDLFTWAGGSSSDLSSTTGVYSLNADGTDYAAAHAPYLVKWNGTGKNIVIEVTSQPGKVSAGFKMIGGASTSTITVQEADATDGTFTDVENLYISGASNDIVNLETTQAFKSTTRAIKLYYTKGSNVGLGPISIEGAVSYSDYLTTCAAPTCENLGKPSVTVTNKTYNSARLTWADVAHADKYLVKFNGVDQAATSNTYFDATDLDAATTYTYQVKALAEEGQDDWCDGEFTTEANFTTESAPAATLTLSENTVTHNLAGDHTLGEIVTLPSADDCSKKFRGWSVNENCETEPELHAGDSYTLNATSQTLYAVYAKVMSVSDPSLTKQVTGATFAAGEKLVIVAVVGDDKYALYQETVSSSYVQNWAFDNNVATVAADAKKYVTLEAGATSGKYYLGDATNGYVYSGGSNNLSVDATNKTEWTIVDNGDGTFKFNQGRYLSCRSDLTSDKVNLYRLAGSTPAGTYSFDVYKYSAGDATYGEWSTTCTAPLASPTFSVDPADGPFTSAQSVELSATEGTIYYNINSADDPTSASTPYTGAIDVDACGSTTIKAIAISSTNQSLVASATYVLNLPIPSVSAEDPYTEAEAIAVYDGGCYNNEDVWVTGTVQTATFYSSNTYTITLTNGFQFYYFYESYDGENLVPFSSDYIVAGDVLVAKGKLGKHNTTYQIANGYLVSRTPASKTPIDSDIDHPITVAAARDYIDQSATYELTDVYVKGVASENPNSAGTFNIHDADVDNTFQIYKGVLSQELIDAGVVVEENDTVIAVGELTKYYSTYEMAEGGEIVVVKKYNAPVVNVESVDMTESSASVEVGETVTLHAAVNPDNATDQAIVWSVQSGNDYASVDENGVVTGTAEGTAVIRAAAHEDESIYAECTVTVTSSSIPENTDIITAAKIGVTGTSYAAWEDKTGFGTSSVYAGNSTNGSGTNAGAIQLRYNTATDKQSGIVLTSSNGLVLKGLSVTVKSGSNTLNVYARNTAYDGYSDLYSSDEDVRGTLIGTVSATGAMTLQDGVSYDDNYQYIGMRSNNGALYLTDITITWGNAVTPTPTEYTVLFTSAHGTEPDPVEAASVTLVELTEDGWTHTGWTADADVEVDDATVTAGTLIANGKTAVLSSDVEFTAVWEEDTPTPVYTEVRNGLTEGWYYTMCLDKAVTAVQGGSIWRVLSKAANGTDVILEEVLGTLDAGRPYIFRASASTLQVAYTGDAVGAPLTTGNNGLVGSFTEEPLAQNSNHYIIYNNALYYVNSDNVKVGAHRAYLDMTGVPAYNPGSASSPRRRVTMTVHGEQVATGMDALDASEKPVKMVINGQLFILRGEKMYDATGRLVK